MLSRIAASRRQALGPDPGWVCQIAASSRSASASGAYISSRGTRNAGSGQRGRGWRGYGAGSGLSVPRLPIHVATSAEVA